jgi:hypothetical protein
MPGDFCVTVAGTHEFRFSGGPIDQPEDHQHLFYLIGHAAASWARLEQHVDCILMHLNKAQRSAEIVQLYSPDNPGSFPVKVKTLSRYFRTHPALSEHKQAFLGCADSLKRLSSEKRGYSNGILEAHNAESHKFTVNGSKFLPATEDFLAKKKSYSETALIRFAEQVNAINNKLEEISSQVLNEATFGKLQKQKLPKAHWWRRVRNGLSALKKNFRP